MVKSRDRHLIAPFPDWEARAWQTDSAGLVQEGAVFRYPDVAKRCSKPGKHAAEIML